MRTRANAIVGAVANHTLLPNSWYHLYMTTHRKPPKVRPVESKQPTAAPHSSTESTKKAEDAADASYADTHTHLYIADVADKTDDEIGDLIDAIIEG